MEYYFLLKKGKYNHKPKQTFEKMHSNISKDKMAQKIKVEINHISNIFLWVKFFEIAYSCDFYVFTQ